MEGSSSDPMLNTWQTKIPDYTVYGISTCNSTTGNQNIAYSGNNNDFNQGTSGINCWCRMMLPVRSAWIYKYEFGSGSDCGSNCAEYCNSYTRNAQGFREAFYTTAGN